MVTKQKVRSLQLNNFVVTDVKETKVEILPTLTSGTKIATIEVNDQPTDIFTEKVPKYVGELKNDKNYVSKDSYATVDDGGTIKLGFQTQERAKNYAVQLSSDGRAYVNVNWTGGSATDVAVDNETIKKKDDGTFQIYVNSITKDKISDFGNYLTSTTHIPTTVEELADSSEYAKVTSLPEIATADKAGTILLGYEESEDDKNYPVVLDDGRAYVHVPWISGSAADVDIDNQTITRNLEGKLQVNQIVKSQVSDFGTYLTSTTHIPTTVEELADSDQYAKKSDIPNRTSLLVNDSNLVSVDNYATAALGGTIRTGFDSSDKTRNYGVQLSSNGRAYVNVPWKELSTDNATIKIEEGTNKLYVNSITKDKISDFGNYLTADTVIPEEDNSTIKRIEGTNKLYVNSITKDKISDFPNIPQKTSDLTNDSGFITLDSLKSRNIVIDPPILFKGDYSIGTKSVEVIKAGWTTPDGMTLDGLLKTLFTGELRDSQPKQNVLPGVSMTVLGIPTPTPENPVTIGDTITLTCNLVFEPGSYVAELDGQRRIQDSKVALDSSKDFTYKTELTGSSITTCTQITHETATSVAQVVTFNVKNAGSMTFNIKSVANHTEGNDPLTFQGLQADPEVVAEVKYQAAAVEVAKDYTITTTTESTPDITNPTATLEITGGIPTTVKIGDTITPAFKATFNPGKFTAYHGTTAGAAQETGVTAIKYTIQLIGKNDEEVDKIEETTSDNTFTGVFPGRKLTEQKFDEKIKFKVIVQHSNSTKTAKTYHGVDVPECQIAEGDTNPFVIEKAITIITYNYHIITKENSVTELSDITDDNITSKARQSYTNAPTELPFAMTTDSVIAIYTAKTKNVSTVKVGKYTLVKNDTYSTTKFDCFEYDNEEGVLLSINSKIEIS